MGARLLSDRERLRRGSDGEDDRCPDGNLSIETESCLVVLLAELPGAVLELGGRREGVGFGSFEEADGGVEDRGSEVESFGGIGSVVEAVLGGSCSVSVSSCSRSSLGVSLSSDESSLVSSGSLAVRGSVGSISLSICPSVLGGVGGESLEI